jgi:hypothetical protein
MSWVLPPSLETKLCHLSFGLLTICSGRQGSGRLCCRQGCELHASFHLILSQVSSTLLPACWPAAAGSSACMSHSIPMSSLSLWALHSLVACVLCVLQVQLLTYQM